MSYLVLHLLNIFIMMLSFFDFTHYVNVSILTKFSQKTSVLTLIIVNSP